ncbi:MAG: ABC transporter permease [Clostridium sp.]|nr:ABC transporter permease [Clostridium sp.]
MAIFLIVALGVGFFAGLKITHSVMVQTAGSYLSGLHFYDYRLVSTMGFDEDAEDIFEKEADALAAEGSKSADVLMVREDDSELAVKTIEIPQKVNLVKLESGRMPAKSNECVVDSHEFGETEIGSILRISDDNDEEVTEKFRTKEFVIVGVVSSPLYIRYDRGNTSIGDGVLDAFVYIDDSAYDMDYDTEIYVELLKGQSGEQSQIDADRQVLYSDAYKTFIEDGEKAWEEKAKTVAQSRYGRFYEEASQDIADAEKTLEEERADAEKELAKAKRELMDGKQELADGEAAIRKAKSEIDANEKKLHDSEQKYRQGVKEYDKSKETYDKGKKSYEKAKAAYDEEYAKSYPEYEKNLESYHDGKAAYETSEREYREALAGYEAVKSSLPEEEQRQKETELALWKARLDETAKTLAEAKTQLDQAESDFQTARSQLDETQKELKKGAKELAKAKEQLEDAKTQIADGKKQLSKAKEQIALKEQELLDGKQELLDGESDYEAGVKEYEAEMEDAEEKIADAKEELKDFKQPDVYVLGRDTNSGYVNFETDSEILMGIANVFPVFFFLVAALVCITTMTRMMEEQRTQVGILKALGYSNGAIIGKYMAYSVSASLAGAVTGFFLGTWIFPWVMWAAYKMMYNMGASCYVFDGRLAVFGIMVALLCSGGTTLVCCYQELSEMAASLMRPKAPKSGKRVLLEKIPVIWSRLRFLDKVSVRNLFRYKKRFFMMIIGISGCTALLVAAFGIKDSVSSIADKQFGEIFVYDISVNVRENADIETLDASGCGDVEKCLPVLGQSVDMTAGERSKAVNLLVPKSAGDFDSYMSLCSVDGEKLTFPENGEVFITAKLAERCHIEVGDTILLKNSGLKGGEIKVGGIFQNYFNHYILATPETYENLFGEKAVWNEEFVNIGADANVHEVSAALMKNEDVVNVSVNEDIRQSVADMMLSLNYVVLLVIGCAAALAFVVIYNLNNINITERIREIATVKVLGFYREETKSYIFRENVVLTLFGSLLGLVLGRYLHAFIMSEINLDAISFDTHVRVLSYVYSVVGTLLFNWLVNLFMSGKLEKVQMAESLKSVD